MRESHDHVTNKLARRLARDPAWKIVTADVRGWGKPPTLNGHRGDVYAEHEDGTKLLIEIEHRHTLTTSHTQKQLTAFERWEQE